MPTCHVFDAFHSSTYGYPQSSRLYNPIGYLCVFSLTTSEIQKPPLNGLPKGEHRSKGGRSWGLVSVWLALHGSIAQRSALVTLVLGCVYFECSEKKIWSLLYSFYFSNFWNFCSFFHFFHIFRIFTWIPRKKTWNTNHACTASGARVKILTQAVRPPVPSLKDVQEAMRAQAGCDWTGQNGPVLGWATLVWSNIKGFFRSPVRLPRMFS